MFGVVPKPLWHKLNPADEQYYRIWYRKPLWNHLVFFAYIWQGKFSNCTMTIVLDIAEPQRETFLEFIKTLPYITIISEETKADEEDWSRHTAQ